LRFELHNVSDDPIRTDLGQDLKGTFALSVSNPDGTTTSEISLPTVTGFHRTSEITVMPGDTFRQELLLNEWVAFPVAGVYIVEVAMKNPILTGNERVIVEPFRTQINILPRNEARLSETCDRLAAEIENSNSVELAVKAAEALASVRDNIALPYLKRALDSGKYVEPQIIGGLERIGSRQAVDVLIALLGEVGEQRYDASTRAGTRAILARQGLQRIALATNDAELRSYIEDAII